jgi:uncharacterized protein (DUF433 family)
MKFDRIAFDTKIMGGRACIRGMRIPVSVIVRQIAHGETFDEILKGYPDLEPEDFQQAIEYAAWLTQEQVFPAQDGDAVFYAIAPFPKPKHPLPNACTASPAGKSF